MDVILAPLDGVEALDTKNTVYSVLIASQNSDLDSKIAGQDAPRKGKGQGLAITART